MASSHFLQTVGYHIFAPILSALLLFPSIHPLFLVREDHDVFVSFRGEDVRNNFLSHLRVAFHQHSVRSFIDDGMRRGQEITPALLSAIEESKIAVIIFSKNYANSPWCLDELVKIMECHAERRTTAIPIFYKVSPSDVMNQAGLFATAFKFYEESMFQIDQVLRWRNAMKEAAEISGWDSQVTRPESKLIYEVVKDISRRMKMFNKVKVGTPSPWSPYSVLSVFCACLLVLCFYSQPEMAEQYQVFVNYSGEETLVSELYAALDNRNIKAFKDTGHETGREMTETISKAIEESKVAIIIFSRGYAQSRRCLDELAKIIECRRTRNLQVMPVFFHLGWEEVVDMEGGIFAKELTLHEQVVRRKKFRKWKAAMKEAAAAPSGERWEHWQTSNSGFDIVDKISEELEKKLLSGPSKVYRLLITVCSLIGSLLILFLFH